MHKMETRMRAVAASPVILVPKNKCFSSRLSLHTTLPCSCLAGHCDRCVLIFVSRSSALWDLSAIRQAPLVRGSAEALCGFLTRPRTRSIAVVGNGPLKPEQRGEIQACDKVVRFNALNNRSVRLL